MSGHEPRGGPLQNGTVLKGFTNDFLPAKDHFHLSAEGQSPGTRPAEIRVAELKAVFFVKSFQGDPQHEEITDPNAGKPGAGRLIRVVFKDGETLVGTTQGYDRSRPGFFVVPVDPTRTTNAASW